MQKGGNDADDGLIHSQQGGGAGNTGAHGPTTPAPPQSAVSTLCLQAQQQQSQPQTASPLQPQITPVPQLLLQGGQIQALGSPATIVHQGPTTGSVIRTFPQQSALTAQHLSGALGSSVFLTSTDSSGVQLTTQSITLPSNTSISASGGTIHHHGQSPTRGGLPPLTNTQQTMSGSNVLATGGLQQRQPRDHGVVPSGNAAVNRNLFEGLTKSFAASTAALASGPSPRKRARVEEKPAATPEIANNRKVVLEAKGKELRELKESYIEHLTELFFLQNGGNVMDYFTWKKRPTPQLVHFLKSGNLDSDEEDDHQVQVNIYNDEVKVLTGAGSNIPLATPVAISTTLPPSVTALNQGGRSGVTLSQVQPAQQQSQSIAVTATTIVASTASSAVTPLSVSTTSTYSTDPTITPTGGKPILSPRSPPPNLHTQLAKCIASLNAEKIKTALTTSISGGSPKSRLPFPYRSQKQPIASVYDNTLGSQEAIVERAKQEAQVMQRVADLRKEGMWSSRRLPKVQEPPRNKAHWDYLLEEMQWLAADFAQERKWKKAGARKIARMVAKYHQELHQKEVRAEKEEALKLKRIASQLAKQIKEFWTNIEKVVQYKQQTRLEEKRKKALDLHLNFIVDQTEKYSTWLTEGLTGSTAGSVCSEPLNDQSQISGDEDFQPALEDSDDEETIDIEEKEAGVDEVSTQEEIEALQKESELPIEELIRSLPQGVLSTAASLDGQEEEEVDVEGHEEDEPSKDDEEFRAGSQEEEDMEDTIEEQEKHERSINRRKEMDELQAEGEMSYEDLVAKYAGAYDSDFEFPQDSTDDETDEDDDSEDEEADTEDTEEYEEEEEAEEQTETSPEDVGLEYLMHPEEKVEEDITVKKEGETAGPGKEITDIAAEALSLQPKGYTLQTTEVKTKVPFLLKHTLREYQHVGLNWLATMYEKRLNGILADEMGLGKTIQTIALLAHLACEKGVWGPHLIVVPTSVMLNWEMEIKKWSPAFKILTYYGNQKERKQKRTGWTKTNAFHICITSYKLVIQDHQSFRRKKWKYLILDEAQNIKNFKSQRWQTLLNFSSQRRLLLTGTPLQNSLMELWSLMHFLMPNVFQSHKEFKEWFANPLTGMIEGSHEYNESLIRRLHKVLRPFLLRRLKDDVEKQMPKKYEHVVMCKLSKRQRYLYDDFMSQTKTKETLATGHFMSVINILMQLRKVCNHPNLFDARPIVSPFQMDGIVFRTASMVLRALEYDPFQMMDIHTFFPSLVSMEMDLPAFVAHRVKKLQTPKPLIVEIDSQPDPPPRPKPAKKPVLFRSSSPLVQQPGSGRASPLTVVSQTITKQARPASPVTIVRTTPSVVKHPVSQVMPVPMKLGVTSTLPVQIQKPGIASPVTVASLLQQAALPTAMQFTTAEQFIPRAPTTIATVQATMQTKLPTVQGSAILTTSGSSPGMQSQPITVQIQQTEQGTRLMIPSGQLSQLPAGFIQIVQTSVGQQLITTTNPSTPVQSVVAVQASSTPTANPIVNGVPVATVAASIQPTYSVSMATSTPVLISQPKPSPAVQLPLATTQTIARPVMRVSPLAAEPAKPFTTSVTSISTAGGSALTLKSVREQPKTAPAVVAATKPVVKKPPKPKSEYHMDSLEARRLKCRKDKLDFISKLNKRHCDGKPVYGQDFYKSVNLMQDAEQNKSLDCMWRGQGYVHCYNAQHCKSPHRTDHYLSQTGSLSRVIHTPEQYLDELSDILKRYVFVTPSVMAPTIKLHASHPPPSFLCREEQRKHQLQMELAPKTACLHSTSTKMTVLFPELRLIQYDCGKLQTMDILLRKLKSGDHRVLIFTQMTKMLDVLETFLNYHGHRYLRLDGTTKVEQRQALMERFNADRRIFCFILSTRSGGLGVNLTGADTVIFYDSDWNPTMDAQAQDRCHRIGQTRDVHIYRLISEKTIEENILKKANQKRLLGDLAIEGGSFTTAFFKEATLKDLFEEPSGLDQLAKEKAETKERKEARARSLAATNLPGTPAESKAIVAKFEEALCKAEDETDVIAANQVRAEQKAELAEFDENIPWDEKEERRKDEEEVSKVEMELAMLEKELSPVERYAVCYMESQMEPHNVEELEIAEEEVEVAKNSWELARLKALKEEEERRAEWEDDEMLFTYSRDSAYNQVKKGSKSRRSQGGGKGTPQPTQPRPSRASSRRSAESNLNKASAESKSSAVKSKQVIEVVPVSKSETATLAMRGNAESAKSVAPPLNIVIPSKPCINSVQSPNYRATSPIARVASPVARVASPIARVTSPVTEVASPANGLARVASPTVNSSRTSNVLSPKENSNPSIPQPWSNPNLVIRTRRASKKEAILKQEERLRQDSENSEVDVLSVASESLLPHPGSQNSSVSSSRGSSRCNSPVYLNPSSSKSLPDLVIRENCKPLEKQPVKHRTASQESTNGIRHVNNVGEEG